MTIAKSKRMTIDLADAGKRGLRTQFGAFPWRKHRDEVQVMLVTSRGSKRWITPKGWPVDGLTPWDAAAEEAMEEAGVTGRIDPNCMGIYSYIKGMDDKDDLPCVVALFPLKVKSQANEWPEKGERKRRWFPLKKAASLVQEADLKALILNFEPPRR